MQDLFKHLKSVMDAYSAVGLSANQIGVPLQIVAIQLTYA